MASIKIKITSAERHRILALLARPPRATRIVFTVVDLPTLTFLKGITMYTMTDTQKAPLSIEPVDKAGNPAPVEGPPSWEASDPNLLDVTPSADGLSAVISAKGPLGSCQVTVNADADVGEGVVPITGVLDVQIVAGQAVALKISAGPAEEQ